MKVVSIQGSLGSLKETHDQGTVVYSVPGDMVAALDEETTMMSNSQGKMLLICLCGT